MNQFDDQFDEITGAAEAEMGPEFADDPTVTAAPVRVGSEPIPGFAYYVAQLHEPTPGFQFDDKNRPELRHRGTIVQGPGDTVGQTFFASQPLYVPTEKWTNEKDSDGKPVFEAKTSEELDADRTKFKQVMERVKVATGIGVAGHSFAGRTPSLSAAAQYGAQFKDSPLVVVEVKRSTKRGFTKNLIYWDSIRGITEPALDSKLKGKTALDEATLKIAAKNKQLNPKGSAGARVASSAPAASQNID